MTNNAPKRKTQWRFVTIRQLVAHDRCKRVRERLAAHPSQCVEQSFAWRREFATSSTHAQRQMTIWAWQGHKNDDSAPVSFLLSLAASSKRVNIQQGKSRARRARDIPHSYKYARGQTHFESKIWALPPHSSRCRNLRERRVAETLSWNLNAKFLALRGARNNKIYVWNKVFCDHINSMSAVSLENFVEFYCGLIIEMLHYFLFPFIKRHIIAY
jgi:hypothetical protein